MSEQNDVQREKWGTRAAFVLAAIGSAVGLGNLWGFPYKVYAFGGGAFLVPYFVAMVVMGIPLLIMEFSVGHWAQQSPPGAFAAISGRYRFVGWWLVALAFIIITYYTVILGYCVIFLIESIGGVLGGELPWSGGAEEAHRHFYGTLLDHAQGYQLGGVRWPVLGAMVLSWVLIYLCLFRGVKWVSKVVLLTVPLPWIMLVILTVRGLTLPGAATGLQFYLEPHWGKLAQVDTWRWAFGQVFFSMSLGFAVMLSYASFLHRRSDLSNNALIIGLGDLATSFVAGIAVFGTLGGMAMAVNTRVEEVVTAGPGLVFVTFPYALSKLPAGQAVFSLVFFIALLTLGIDSAFSIVEACLASVCDNLKKWSRTVALPVICLLGAGIGVVYCLGGGGLNVLYYADDLINGPLGILVVALAECLIVGWACRGKFVKHMRRHANQRSDWMLYPWWDAIVRYVAPVFLVVLITWSVADFVTAGKWALLAGSGVFLLIPIVFSFLVSRKPHPAQGTEEVGSDDGKAGILLAVVPLASILTGVVLGLVRRATAGAPRPPASKPVPGPFVEQEMGVTGYSILTGVVLLIVVGFVWCFWRAMQAAGGRDTEIDAAEGST